MISAGSKSSSGSRGAWVVFRWFNRFVGSDQRRSNLNWNDLNPLNRTYELLEPFEPIEPHPISED
jgi:hypothetical protein